MHNFTKNDLHRLFLGGFHTIKFIVRKSTLLLSCPYNCNQYSRMNPISTVRKASFLLVLLCPALTGISQSLYLVSLQEKLRNSPIVAEGKVISQESFWNPRHTMIFTSSKVEVYKVFKGTAVMDTIEIMTQGGIVGLQQIEVSDLLGLRKNDIGVFCCYPNQLRLTAPRSGNTLYDVYSSSQGFFKYNLSTQTASDPLLEYGRIETELYPTLQKATGRSFLNKRPSFRVSTFAAARVDQANAVSISGFSPATVNAGATLDPTNNVLTITGSGFDSTGGNGAIFFDDNNVASGTFPVLPGDPLILVWNDNTIQVRVPSRAGTGTVSVRNGAGSTNTTATALTVWYSILTGTFSFSGVTVTKELNLMNTNGAGGYNIFYSTNTANGGVDMSTAPQKATFQRALATWRELTGANIVEGTPNTTTNQTLNTPGAIGTIMFDNTNTSVAPLASGVLAVCYSYASMCLPLATNEPQRTGFDIVIRNAGVSLGATTFTSGPCPPGSTSYSDVDLETVLLHELGHAMNLGHIKDNFQSAGFGYPFVNPGKLMHFAVLTGVKRTSPDYSAFQAALYTVTPQSNTYGSCSLFPNEMTQLAQTVDSKDECPASFPSTALAAGTSVPFDLAHTTSNRLTDPFYRGFCISNGTGITNTAYYPFKTSAGGTLSITVSGYTTTPAAQAACSITGVEMALYQVSSCPTGQAFPATAGCATFAANGVVNFSGLSAATDYLLVADGIENTKAAFTLAFAGAALPVKLSAFTGTPFSNYNQLYWTFDMYYNVQQVVIEKSADGQTFDAIGSIPAALVSTNGTFKDAQPLMGDNYYRLAIINIDGTKEYTTIVLLKRKDNLLVSAWPNPVHGLLNVEVNGVMPGTYSFVLYNSMGQQVQRTTATLNLYKQIVQLDAGRLPGGMYHLAVYNAKGIPVSETKIEVR